MKPARILQEGRSIHDSMTRQTIEFIAYTRDVFYVRREVDLLKTAKVNAYIMHIFGKLEL